MVDGLTKKGYSDINPNAFLILDDCLYDASWAKDKNIKTCFMNGRHWHILFIITMQYPLGIPPIYELILIMFLFYEKILYLIENVYMIIMLVCFPVLKFLVSYGSMYREF